MGDEQQQPEQFETKSQHADASPQADPPAEMVSPREQPSACEGEATVLSGEQSLNSTISTRPVDSLALYAPSNCTETRFRILRSHTRRSLGEVFVTRNEELNRDVTLKEILREHARIEQQLLKY